MATAAAHLDVGAVRAALLDFFDTAARELPWRGPAADPYVIWVSEVMAQQTRVETVVPYFERWMLRFPVVAALAEAPLDDVLRLWEGLGYYSRARNLHSAALIMRERHAGAVPDTYAALRSLPGVGEYTAGAVSSMAFGERVPAVDGNVRRVLARLLDEPAPSPAQLREVATALVPADRPGDFNQALMELGATICTPRRPRCHRCVIAEYCASRAAGTQLSRPLPRKRSTLPAFDIATAILRRDDGRVLIARRPPTGLLAGLWNFPGREMQVDEIAATVVERIAAASGEIRSAAVPLCVVEHVFSHRRERYHCMVVEVEPHVDDARSAGMSMDHVAWVGADARGFALPRAQRRIHTAVFASAT
jgi:A/G-specific adenine glycosylase